MIMGTAKTIQKIIFIGVLVVSVPLLALNVIMPRLGIVTAMEEGLQFELKDLTVFNYSYNPAASDNYYLSNDTEDWVELDFWLELGLGLKDGINETKDVNGTEYDVRYYDENGTVLLDNLKNPTEEILIPVIKMDAYYKGRFLGSGGSRKTYVLNANQPVQMLHLYLRGSREFDGGLMFLFNSITQDGTLDTLLLGAVGGSGGSFSASALLADLELVLTAYIGSAPVTIQGLDLFGSTVQMPVIKGDIASSQYVNDPSANDYSQTIGAMERFTAQLGVDDFEPLLEKLGLMENVSGEWVYATDKLVNAVNQIFNDTIINERTYELEVNAENEVWYLPNGGNLNDDYAYSNVTMYENASSTIAEFKASEDDADGNPDTDIDMATINSTLLLGWSATQAYLESWATNDSYSISNLNNTLINNASSPFNLYYDADYTDEITVKTSIANGAISEILGDAVTENITNAAFGYNITVTYTGNILNLFTVMNAEGYNLGDLFNGIGSTVPEVLSTILFGNGAWITDLEAGSRLLLGEEYTEKVQADNSVAPVLFESTDPSSLLIIVSIGAFVVLFLLFAITKGSVKINRREFLSRDDVQTNVNMFIKEVERLGGKVSTQNAEALSIRAFRRDGKIEKSSNIGKRAKEYVENQKLLVTLQSRASRAYVAQKFKDCIAAIEKMIQIARKLEDQTLVANYEENLAKVVKLLRRKGISVSTKVRIEEGQKPSEELEKLSMYKKDLIDLQNKASKYFAEKNFSAAKECIKEMLSIAKKIQDPVLIRNYEANLRKIIAMEKGGGL